MTPIRKLRLFLWGVDPGYFRLKHALKTVMAILITLTLSIKEPLFGKLMAGIACGFSLQGIIAKSFALRVIQVIVFDLVYFMVFILGLKVRDSHNMTALVLIGLGFAVNYCRRFGLQNSMAPMMAWILCFFATILPFDTPDAAWMHLHALIIGLLVAALVAIFIFPENYPKLYIKNSNRLFKLLARGMREIRYYLVKRDVIQSFEKLSFVRLKHNMNHLLDSNQTIEQSDVFDSYQSTVSEILVHQYAFVSAYTMMVEAYHVIKIYDYQLPRSVRLSLVVINRRLAALFDAVRMRKDFVIRYERVKVSLRQLDESMSHELLTEPTLVMALLNLKLTFNLLNQHMAELVRIQDGASQYH
ncbi:hypothetical protein [Legionella sp. 16cNR16C]|uniref:hypothetical protein n=1 Tax=Legionella sp. 16cNR16C TaxID=2905656 RepID=UPI001E31CE68|nr:hypothetical protein [Legionella sp. 16cNR16C]MCE3043660.1 hypothetical protein [Legionella sp. 16cNR16C]